MQEAFGADRFLLEQPLPAVPEQFTKAPLLRVGRALPAFALPSSWPLFNIRQPPTGFHGCLHHCLPCIACFSSLGHMCASASVACSLHTSMLPSLLLEKAIMPWCILSGSRPGLLQMDEACQLCVCSPG